MSRRARVQSQLVANAHLAPRGHGRSILPEDHA
jgi:hypothetical protein